MKDTKSFIDGKWGPKAVVEWLFHIALDNLETSTKFADKTYCLSYAGIEVNFKEGEIISCKFRKDYSGGKSSITEYKKE